MGERLFEILRVHFNTHGYWTVGLVLLLENAGVPVPGETILLFASFLAFSQNQLHLPGIILIGTLAAALGDNLGYLIGHHGGRPLLERYQHLFRLRSSHLERGERLFQRYGARTIFFARFVFGMRVIAGPLAGVLRMPWKQFALCNFLGAALWVTVISCVGYCFGRNWNALLALIHHFNLAILLLLAVVFLLLWLRRNHSTPER